uniref:Uncharacterized protein n=1 Tax=Magallana gigas TaxID=29159 RepID=K1PHK5_MAGGI
MSETSKSSKVNDYFEKAVMLLPMENCDSGALQEMYINLVREFGTHYTTEVVMGAKAVQQLTFSKSDLSKLESEGISAKVAAQASFSGFGASGGGGFSVGVSSKEEAFNRVQNTNKEQYEYYIGGNPPSGDFSSGSTESLREWARSADEKPVPIQYKMTSIDNLLKPGYFKDITYVTTFSDYGGLFQIKSNDDDATTVGTPLEYGQVFKLVTVQGENLFLGRAFIDDVKYAPSNKLQDAFNLKDGRKSWYKWYHAAFSDKDIADLQRVRFMYVIKYNNV